MSEPRKLSLSMGDIVVCSQQRGNCHMGSFEGQKPWHWPLLLRLVRTELEQRVNAAIPSCQGTYGAVVLTMVLVVVSLPRCPQQSCECPPAMPKLVNAKTKLPDTTKVPSSKAGLAPVVLHTEARDRSPPPGPALFSLQRVPAANGSPLLHF